MFLDFDFKNNAENYSLDVGIEYTTFSFTGIECN